MRAEFAAVSGGFDKMPILTGNNGQTVLVNAGGTGLESANVKWNLAGYAVTFMASGNATINLPISSGTLATTSELVDAVPPGTVSDYAGLTVPNGWLFCNGQTVSRTTYDDLFLAIGTIYNTGGEAGTDFRLPDLRGRVTAGFDNMGGAANAGRLGLMASTTAGGVGGAQSVALDTTMMPAHNHAVTDGTHAHGYSDPTHAHSIADPTHSHGIGDPWHSHYFPASNAGCGCTGGGSVMLNSDGYTNASPTGIWTGGSGTGIGIYGNYIGITILAAGSNISIQNNGSGAAHSNIQPTMVMNKIIKI